MFSSKKESKKKKSSRSSNTTSDGFPQLYDQSYPFLFQEKETAFNNNCEVLTPGQDVLNFNLQDNSYYHDPFLESNKYDKPYLDNEVEYDSLSKNLCDIDNSWFYDMLHLFKSNKYSRTVQRDIPDGILPMGLSGTLKDISVNARQNDDELYMKNEDLRKFLPRGLSIINIMKNNKQFMEQPVIFANRKFFDSDTDLDSKNIKNMTNYFLEDVIFTSKILAMEKMNGEAAHFSGRRINGQFYLVAGSKNVHMVFNSLEHIELYTEQRYLTARVIAKAVLAQWRTMPASERIQFEEYLDSSRCTVVCEMMMHDRQHVVPLETCGLVVLCVTSPPCPNPTSLTAMSPEQCLRYFEKLGFDIPDYEELDLGQMRSHGTSARSKHNTEGVVYYYENYKGETIGLLKFKSIWYTHLRALRQQASYRHRQSGKSSKSIEKSKEQARSRMEELQKWLLTSEERLESWKELSDQWLEWLEVKADTGMLDAVSLRGNFPSVWKCFTESTEFRSNVKALL